MSLEECRCRVCGTFYKDHCQSSICEDCERAERTIRLKKRSEEDQQAYFMQKIVELTAERDQLRKKLEKYERETT